MQKDAFARLLMKGRENANLGLCRVIINAGLFAACVHYTESIVPAHGGNVKKNSHEASLKIVHRQQKPPLTTRHAHGRMVKHADMMELVDV